MFGVRRTVVDYCKDERPAMIPFALVVWHSRVQVPCRIIIAAVVAVGVQKERRV